MRQKTVNEATILCACDKRRTLMGNKYASNDRNFWSVRPRLYV